MATYNVVTTQPLRGTILALAHNRAPHAATVDTDSITQAVSYLGVEYEVRMERLHNPATNLFWWQEVEVYEVVS